MTLRRPLGSQRRRKKKGGVGLAALPPPGSASNFVPSGVLPPPLAAPAPSRASSAATGSVLVKPQHVVSPDLGEQSFHAQLREQRTKERYARKRPNDLRLVRLRVAASRSSTLNRCRVGSYQTSAWSGSGTQHEAPCSEALAWPKTTSRGLSKQSWATERREIRRGSGTQSLWQGPTLRQVPFPHRRA